MQIRQSRGVVGGGPNLVFITHFYCQRSTRADTRGLRGNHQSSGCVLNCAAETEPPGRDDSSHVLRGNVCKIQRDQSEAATLQQQISSFEGPLNLVSLPQSQIPIRSATHP